MDFFKVPVAYAEEGPLIQAGEKAEVLFMRAKAHCAKVENDGFVHKEMLARLTPTQPLQRARALCAAGLWKQVEDGYQFTVWDQITRAELEEGRADARARQRRSRSRRRPPDSPGVTRDNPRDSRAGHGTEVEEEVEAACGSSNAPEALPPPLEILRAALEARKLRVRWDRLSDEQTTEIEQLVMTHGDAALVASAVREFRPDRPAVFAQAWLPGWRQLRQPGHLALVTAEPCTRPGHTGTTSHCKECAVEDIPAYHDERRTQA